MQISMHIVYLNAYFPVRPTKQNIEHKIDIYCGSHPDSSLTSFLWGQPWVIEKVRFLRLPMIHTYGKRYVLIRSYVSIYCGKIAIYHIVIIMVLLNCLQYTRWYISNISPLYPRLIIVSSLRLAAPGVGVQTLLQYGESIIIEYKQGLILSHLGRVYPSHLFGVSVTVCSNNQLQTIRKTKRLSQFQFFIFVRFNPFNPYAQERNDVTDVALFLC